MDLNDIEKDRALFARIAEGDTISFRQLFDSYYPSLRFNALKFLKSEYWAEEVAQEVLLQVWENREGLLQIENPASWLYRITANKSLDKARHQDVMLRAQYILRLAKLAEQDDSRSVQFDYILLRKVLKEAVDSLPEQQRLAWQLQQEGLSYKEIGAQLGISHHTVRNHLIRASRHIRQYIISHGEFLLFALYFPLFS